MKNTNPKNPPMYRISLAVMALIAFAATASFAAELKYSYAPGFFEQKDRKSVV